MTVAAAAADLVVLEMVAAVMVGMMAAAVAMEMAAVAVAVTVAVAVAVDVVVVSIATMDTLRVDAGAGAVSAECHTVCVDCRSTARRALSSSFCEVTTIGHNERT